MSRRSHALFAGPLLVVLTCLISGSPTAGARERLENDADDANTRPAETRRARLDRRDDAGDRRMRQVDVDGEGEDNDDNDRRVARRRGADREWFRDPGYYGYGNFPSMEMHDAVVANARAATARAIFRRAENALNSAVRKTVRTFENSAELREARKTEKDAYEAYTAARRRALQSVLEDPKYRAIMTLRQELTDQINYKRANRPYDDRTDKQVMEDILTMATLKMNYAADARAMERLALMTNAQAMDAQSKLRQAAVKSSELKHDFDEALRNDRDLLAARRNLEDARIARLTASAYLKGALVAAEEALDFAYYLNRYSRYNGADYDDYRNYYPYSYPLRYAGY
jgi:hypothetical protein